MTAGAKIWAWKAGNLRILSTKDVTVYLRRDYEFDSATGKYDPTRFLEKTLTVTPGLIVEPIVLAPGPYLLYVLSSKPAEPRILNLTAVPKTRLDVLEAKDPDHAETTAAHPRRELGLRLDLENAVEVMDSVTYDIWPRGKPNAAVALFMERGVT